MGVEEIVESAVWAYRAAYGSLVLQSGERTGAAFVSFVEDVLQEIGRRTGGELGITLSLGEQPESVYRRWFEAGAHRYLLRIETTRPELYRQLHPADHRFEERLDCLRRLRRTGYQVGTGVMIGLPGQAVTDLADDVLFFRERDIDMIGMGPYIPHADTPLSGERERFRADRQFLLGLKMIAVTRLVLRDVNIAATTALQALHPEGREQGLLAGANIVMPNVTATKYRDGYRLYDDKPCLDENSSMCKACLRGRIEAIGERIGFGLRGDSPHFFRRQARRSSSRVRGR